MSNYRPKSAVRHVVHDYASLEMAGKHTQTGLPYPFNHYAERTFLTHCRALADFFDPHRRDPRDLHANDFTVAPFSARLPTWKKLRDHIDKHLMHLTVGRLRTRRKWTGKPNKALLKEFRREWDKFIKALKPRLKPLFEAELKKY